MKRNFSYFLAFGVVLTLTLFAGAPQAQAQESIPGYDVQDDPLHPGLNTDDKTLLIEPFRVGRDSTFIPVVRPTATATTKKAEAPKTSNGRAKTEEEDPLSFNFLYYIIQKFKTSDIIDQ